jgi:hypothetical protein
MCCAQDTQPIGKKEAASQRPQIGGKIKMKGAPRDGAVTAMQVNREGGVTLGRHGTCSTITTHTYFTDNIVRAGLNYQFHWSDTSRNIHAAGSGYGSGDVAEASHENWNNNRKSVSSCPPAQFVSANLVAESTDRGRRPCDGLDIFFRVSNRQTG